MHSKKKFFLRLKHKIPFIGVLCLVLVYVWNQSVWANQSSMHQMDMLAVNNQPANDTVQKKLINLKYASEQIIRDSLMILIDSVELEHQGAILYCDSASVSIKANTFEAFGDVEMNQGDSIFLYGDYMRYDANTQLVRVKYNVKLEHLSGILYTDSLDYDRINNVGYYTEGGYLVDSLNTLNSKKGYYEPNKSLATFVENVELENPNFTLFSDTLLYNAKTQIAEIVSYTKIVSDSGIIYGNRGSYNTQTEDAILLDQSKIINNLGSRILLGDSIVYMKGVNNAEVFGNMFLQDTIQKLILKGNYGTFYSESNYAFATDSAQLISYNNADSLYLHADTLEMFKFEPQKILKLEKRILGDSVVYDSIYTEESPMRFNAFHNVRFYRSNLQGVCDSLVYNSIDSLLRMYRDPVLWSENRQISGDTIQILLNDSTMDRMYVKGNAFSIEQKSDLYYNQLKSRELTMYMLNGKIKRIYAEGNVETITYPEERDGTLNRVQSLLICSFLNIDFNEGAFERLKAWPTPTGKATPFLLLTPENLKLEYFNWYDYLKPADKYDIFRRVKKQKTNERPRIAIDD